MRARRLCLAVLAVAALAWCPGAMGEDLSVPVADSCPEAPEERYFPVGTFYSRPHRSDIEAVAVHHDQFVRQWFSQALGAMEEPSLSCAVLKEADAYRFLRLPTWGAAVAVRVFRHGNDYRLEAVILSGMGGYDPGQVSRRITKNLSRAQWQSVIATLEHVGFWQMPRDSNRIDGTDGERWVVEGHRGGRHRIVHRWMGYDIEAVGRLLLGLAGLGG